MSETKANEPAVNHPVRIVFLVVEGKAKRARSSATHCVRLGLTSDFIKSDGPIPFHEVAQKASRDFKEITRAEVCVYGYAKVGPLDVVDIFPMMVRSILGITKAVPATPIES